MNKRNFFLQTTYGLAGYIEQELGMARGRHFRFDRKVTSHKVLCLWLTINPKYVKRLKGMTEELSLAARLDKGDLIRTELGGRGVILLQIPLPEYLRTSPQVDELPVLTGCQTAVGLDIENKAATVNFDNPLTSHALISGLTGSGKTNLGRLLVYLLAQQNQPDAIKFLLFDIADSGLAWKGFDDLPHLYHGVVSDMQTASEGMEWLEGELNRRAEKRTSKPKLVVGIDEVQVFTKEREIAGTLEKLSQRGRKWGMSLLLLTQRPTKGSLSTTTKANCGIRIVGKVTNSQESVWASGLSDIGGEALGGLGDMLLVQNGSVQRIASPLFADKYLGDLPRNGRDWVEFPNMEGEHTQKQDMARRKPDPMVSHHVAVALAHGGGMGINRFAKLLRIGNSKAQRVLEFADELRRDLGLLGCGVYPNSSQFKDAIPIPTRWASD